MTRIFLSPEEQEILVFKFWQSLAYKPRMLMSFGCILAGFVLQLFPSWILDENFFLDEFFRYIPYFILPGTILLLAGSLLILVRGYDNRVNFGAYSPNSAWEQVEQSKLLEAEQLVRNLKKWEYSSTSDFLNVLGKTFFLIIITFTIMISLGKMNFALMIIVLDVLLLFFPLWNTGKLKIITKPNLLLKIDIIKELLQQNEERLQRHQVDYFMLLKGTESRKAPEDVKFRVKIRDHHPDFLGLYGQIVTNSVSGASYPYFYMVLVAKKGYGLEQVFRQYSAPQEITKEYKLQDDVEVFVIRQTTTKISGYHTKYKMRQQILLEGVSVAEEAAVKETANHGTRIPAPPPEDERISQ